MTPPRDPHLRRELSRLAWHLRQRARQYEEHGAIEGSPIWNAETERMAQTLHTAADVLVAWTGGKAA